MVDTQQIRVLVVEDDPELASLIRAMLADASGEPRFDVSVAHSIEDAEKLSREIDFEVTLLDLSLPDGWGLDSLIRVRSLFDDVPVVVLTGTQDFGFGESAIASGAEDFLVKDGLGTDQLAWTVRFAVARRRFRRAERVQAAQDAADERAERSKSFTPASERIYGSTPLQESAPDVFVGLRDRYAGIVNLALEQRGYRGDYHVPKHLRDLASSLASLRATPRDVIEVHLAALDRESKSSLPSRQAALLDEARVLALELMGYLASYYRQQAIGTRRGPTVDAEEGR